MGRHTSKGGSWWFCGERAVVVVKRAVVVVKRAVVVVKRAVVVVKRAVVLLCMRESTCCCLWNSCIYYNVYAHMKHHMI